MTTEPEYVLFKDPSRALGAIRHALEVVLYESGEPDRAALMMIGPLILVAARLLLPVDSADSEEGPLPMPDLEALVGASINEYGTAVIEGRIEDQAKVDDVVSAYMDFVAVISVIMARTVGGDIDFVGHPALDALYREFVTTLADRASNN